MEKIFKEYPRVSDILHPFTSLSLAVVPFHILEEASYRGSYVHALASFYVSGDFIPPLLEENKGYFYSFKKWFDENAEETLLNETRLYHEDLKYCGRPDFIIKLKSDKIALIDLKTSSKIYPNYPLQLAAYMDLANVNDLHCDEACVLQLDKEGEEADLHNFGDCNSYFKKFLSALDLYNHFFRGGEK